MSSNPDEPTPQEELDALTEAAVQLVARIAKVAIRDEYILAALWKVEDAAHELRKSYG